MTDWKDVHGCNSSTEFYDFLISELPANARFLEMGVFYGRGLVYLAKKSNFEVYGVDQFIRTEMPYHTDDVTTDTEFHEACLRSLIKCDALKRTTLIHLPSERAVTLFDDHYFDCVYLDGNHSYEAIANDISLWKPKVKHGGILSGDDYIQPWGGVIKAVDELLEDRHLIGQAWWTWV
jgi:methyltransferase family protein